MGQAQLAEAPISMLEPAVKMTADEVIEEIRRMSGYNRIAAIYNEQSESTKRILCFAAGLSERQVEFKFEKLNQLEKAAMHRAIKHLEPAIKKLASRSLKEFCK